MFRDDEIVTISDPQSIQFQIIDWYSFDFEEEENNQEIRKYIIKIFGVTSIGHSICIDVTDFKPYFYIKCNELEEVTFTEMMEILSKVKKKLPKQFHNCITISKEYKKNIWGFTNNEKHQYLKLEFTNISTFYIVKKFLTKQMNLFGTNIHFKFYESNIEPFIRFIHERNIQPGGWIEIDDHEEQVYLESKCQINRSCSWDNVRPIEKNSIAPFVVLSFDIECTSSHGDFPVAKKTYKKQANEIIENFDNFKKSNNDFNGNCDELEHMRILLLDIFDQNQQLISKAYTKKKVNIDEICNIIEKIKHESVDILRGKNKQFYLNENDEEIEMTRSQILENKLNYYFPPLKGDPVIQIGTTVHKYGETNCSFKSVITLGTCDEIDGVHVQECKTEKEVIIKWCRLLHDIDPDIITGYNILGFDFDYLYQRAQELKCEKYLLKCGRILNKTSEFKEKTLASSALGDNILKYVEMEGRVIIDMMKYVQREYKLDSYKLDNVASSFINGKIKKIENNHIFIDNVVGLNKGDYIKIDSIKHKITDINYQEKKITISENNISSEVWGSAKDDVSPQDIFKCQSGNSTDRAVIAKYCVQDCALCNILMIKLEVIANNLGMANVCYVPLSYIFMRGQGVKIFSLVSKQCKEDGFIIPVIKYDPEKNDDEVGYEGAIVLDPEPGIYVENPISVMDYASLYPSSMISENISHDSIVLDEKYDNLENFNYVDISYDIFDKNKEKVGVKTCRYAQFPNSEKGILPRILMKLLSQRKATRKKATHKTITTKTNNVYTGLMKQNTDSISITTTDNKTITISTDDIENIKDTYNEFAQAVLDGLQLAYKITANSLYGQVGARTSSIYMKELAASTTATGRNLILSAKQFMETNYDSKVIYGDTDSIFVDFKIKQNYNLTDKEALQKSIDIAIEASEKFKHTLKAPHDLEYEKTFFPFIILSKKKYVGNLYEHDVNKFKQKSMGIVLKRRDNANIVKKIYGGIIDILLNKHDIQQSIEFLKTSLEQLINGKFSIDDLIITKTLRQTYADPTRIAHKVLADRMKVRDPGSAPQVNDRIPYVYIEHDTKNKKLLQGDKIEHPKYIIENNIKIDYTFYITNQLMNPICQLLALALFQIPKCKSNPAFYSEKEKKYKREYKDIKKAKDKVYDLKAIEVKELIFQEILTKLNNKRLGNRTITEFFKIH